MICWSMLIPCKECIGTCPLGFKFNSGWHETIFYTWAGHHSCLDGTLSVGSPVKSQDRSAAMDCGAKVLDDGSHLHSSIRPWDNGGMPQHHWMKLVVQNLPMKAGRNSFGDFWWAFQVVFMRIKTISRCFMALMALAWGESALLRLLHRLLLRGRLPEHLEVESLEAVGCADLRLSLFFLLT